MFVTSTFLLIYDQINWFIYLNFDVFLHFYFFFDEKTNVGFHTFFLDIYMTCQVYKCGNTIFMNFHTLSTFRETIHDV